MTYIQKQDMFVNQIRSRRITNSFSGVSGAMGEGDRGAWQTVPSYTGNPYDFTSFLDRWRQYVHLYEICWEARKIVRIPVEDALRKDWEVEDIPEEMTKAITARLKQLNFNATLSRSLMLERLLGGCLTFLGIESDEDNVAKPYHPHEGKRIRFMNAIPISRIARMTWCNDPLSENYMKPSQYIINGSELHVSRCLVWDGDPLFDPYDYALNNFRANLAGFGPSKLAPIWDDIVRAVGTRQAVYQMVQTNNALIMAVQQLQSLGGTSPGKEQIKLLKTIANNLSVYRAAIIEKDKVDISQQSASFGSVPELVISFIQILAAASDIPATRFLGQAPGGLNATGESDLENYYNMIDAYQRNRIEPAIRKMFDIIGFEKFPTLWRKERDKLSIKFPPLWNQTEKEEAETAALRLDNVMKAYADGLIGDDKAIEELNYRGVFSVELDETDVSVMDPFGDTNGGFPGGGGQPGGGNGQQTPPDNRTPFKKPGSVTNPTPAPAPLKNDPATFRNEFNFKRGNKVENASTAYNDGKKIGKEGKGSFNDNPFKQNPEKDEWDRGFEKGHKEFISNIGGYRRIKNSTITNSHWDKVNKNPTEGQRSAGNYQKGWAHLHGLEIRIENPKGSVRTGKDKDGKEWSSILPSDYGYIRKTKGADDQFIDVYLGPFDNDEIYIIDQKNLGTGAFDEHKVLMGFSGEFQAKNNYACAFSDGKGADRILAMTPVTPEEFKKWIAEGNTKNPFKTNEDE